jgi:hypothetical protein
MDTSKQTEGDRQGAQETKMQPREPERAKPPQRRNGGLVNPQDKQLPPSPVLNPGSNPKRPS